MVNWIEKSIAFEDCLKPKSILVVNLDPFKTSYLKISVWDPETVMFIGNIKVANLLQGSYNILSLFLNYLKIL